MCSTNVQQNNSVVEFLWFYFCDSTANTKQTTSSIMRDKYCNGTKMSKFEVLSYKELY